MRLLLAANNQATRRNEIIKSYFNWVKQQSICTPLAPTRNQIIYKTASTDGPNSVRKTFSKPASLKRASLVYGYAADGDRSPLWLCASHNGTPVLVHRQRGTKVFFHQALQDRKLLAIPGIHYFDTHRLRAYLLQAPELQLHPRTSNVTGPRRGRGRSRRSLLG